MTPRQSGVVVAGVGLVAVNYWTSAQRTNITATVWDKKNPSDAHKALVGIAGELVLVGLLTMFAGTDAGANAALAILAALWVLWGITHYAKGSSSHSSATTSSGAGGGARRVQ